MECIQLNFHEMIDYKVAQRCHIGLIKSDLGAHHYAFQLLSAYMERLQIKAPGVHMNLLLNPVDGCFFHCFVCPLSTHMIWNMSQKFMAVDGTFTKGLFLMTLLLAVRIDANGQTYIIAWAIVESENKQSWAYFFYHL